MIKKTTYLLLLLNTIFLYSCRPDYVPKPRGYFRIDLPEKNYRSLQPGMPYVFEYPKYALIQKKPNQNNQMYWINIVFPQYKAQIHISYKQINNNLETYLNDSREFVYKHTIKADAISETPYINDNKKVYGLLYDIKGDAASNIQFYVTDSVKNFVRGALYFNVTPNKDSLAPVIDFIGKDIAHLIETFEWQ